MVKMFTIDELKEFRSFDLNSIKNLKHSIIIYTNRINKLNSQFRETKAITTKQAKSLFNILNAFCHISTDTLKWIQIDYLEEHNKINTDSIYDKTSHFYFYGLAFQELSKIILETLTFLTLFLKSNKYSGIKELFFTYYFFMKIKMFSIINSIPSDKIEKLLN